MSAWRSTNSGLMRRRGSSSALDGGGVHFGGLHDIEQAEQRQQAVVAARECVQDALSDRNWRSSVFLRAPGSRSTTLRPAYDAGEVGFLVAQVDAIGRLRQHGADGEQVIDRFRRVRGVREQRRWWKRQVRGVLVHAAGAVPLRLAASPRVQRVPVRRARSRSARRSGLPAASRKSSVLPASRDGLVQDDHARRRRHVVQQSADGS